jgi:hypothetical protein
LAHPVVEAPGSAAMEAEELGWVKVRAAARTEAQASVPATEQVPGPARVSAERREEARVQVRVPVQVQVQAQALVRVPTGPAESPEADRSVPLDSRAPTQAADLRVPPARGDFAALQDRARSEPARPLRVNPQVMGRTVVERIRRTRQSRLQ